MDDQNTPRPNPLHDDQPANEPWPPAPQPGDVETAAPPSVASDGDVAEARAPITDAVSPIWGATAPAPESAAPDPAEAEADTVAEAETEAAPETPSYAPPPDVDIPPYTPPPLEPSSTPDASSAPSAPVTSAAEPEPTTAFAQPAADYSALADETPTLVPSAFADKRSSASTDNGGTPDATDRDASAPPAPPSGVTGQPIWGQSQEGTPALEQPVASPPPAAEPASEPTDAPPPPATPAWSAGTDYVPPPPPPVFVQPLSEEYAPPPPPPAPQPQYAPPPPPPEPQPQPWQTGPIGGQAPSGPLGGQPYVPPPPTPPQGYPAAAQQPNPYYAPMPPMAAPQNQNATLAIVLEVVCGLFGLFGIGWLVSGNTQTGIILLIGGLIWGAIWVFIAIFTLGIALLCIGPINLAIMITSTIMLNNRLKQMPPAAAM